MTTQVNTVQPQSGRFPQAIIWIAGIALTLFCAVGIAALMGWIPNSMGGSSDKVAVDQPSANRMVPLAQQTRSPTGLTMPVQRAARAHTAPLLASAASCAHCGVIESVREVDAKGQGSGLGAVGGALVGGLLGNQVGAGRGKDAMTVAGAVGGAVAGNEVEKRVKATKSYEITVRLNDGSSRVFSVAGLPAWHIGDKVKVVDGAIQSNA